MRKSFHQKLSSLTPQISLSEEKKEENINLDLLIDSNTIPNFESLFSDKNINKFLRITNIIQTFFETLPLALIQIINNELQHIWLDSHGNINIMVLCSLISSAIMIIQFSIELVQLAYGKNIFIFFQTIDYLNS